jgi:hypothetical protein
VVEFVIDTHQLKMIDKEIMGESGLLYFFEDHPTATRIFLRWDHSCSGKPWWGDN